MTAEVFASDPPLNAPPGPRAADPVASAGPRPTATRGTRMRPRPPLFAAPLAALAVLAAACSGGTEQAPPAAQAGVPPSRPAAPATTPAPPPTAADLMARAGCAGTVIAPQLHAREVGRCTIGGHRVDVAVFDTNEQRDAWAQFGRDVGGTVFVGELWAVGGIGAAGPEAFAAALGR